MSSRLEDFIIERIKKKGWEKHLLDVFYSRVELEVILEAEEPFMIGAGKEISGVVDNPQLRVTKGDIEVPIIPGSSIKGVLRSILEAYEIRRGRLLLHISYDGKDIKCTGEGLADVMKIIEKIRDDDEIINKCLLSPIMILMGAPWIASRTTFGNFYPIQYSMRIISRNAIDRLTGAVQTNKLFSLEVVEPTKLRGRLIFNNVINTGTEVEELAKELLKIMRDGFEVGRYVSSGLGRVRATEMKGKLITLEGSRIKVYPLDASTGEIRVIQ